jgi:hypothetical protein
MAGAGTPQPRAPRGIPEGGQFQASVRPRPPDDALGGYFDDELFATEAPAPVDLDPAEVLDQARRSGRWWARRYGVDPDDLAGQVVEDYLAASARHGPAVANPSGWLHRAARNRASHEATGTTNGADRAALGAYRERIAALGRSASRTEEDRIAEEIRASQPPRRRAREGFHRPAALVHLGDLDPSALGAARTTTIDDEATVDDDPFVETLEAMSPTERRLLRRSAWSLIAGDAPAPVARSLRIDQATTVRSAVARAGGVNAVVRRWYEGDATDAETEALFAPFGDLDNRGRAKVARALLDRPGSAAPLWDSTVSVATARYDKSLVAMRGVA